MCLDWRQSWRHISQSSVHTFFYFDIIHPIFFKLIQDSKQESSTKPANFSVSTSCYDAQLGSFCFSDFFVLETPPKCFSPSFCCWGNPVHFASHSSPPKTAMIWGRCGLGWFGQISGSCVPELMANLQLGDPGFKIWLIFDGGFGKKMGCPFEIPFASVEIRFVSS